MPNKKTYKEEHGTTRVGDFIRKIGRSDILEKAVNIVGDVASGNYLGAVRELIKKDPDITPEQQAEAFKLIELDYVDIADARDMQKIALQQDDIFSKRFVYYFAIGIAGFSMIVVGLLFFIEIPDSNRRVVDMILGVVIGSGLISVINFFFGSSKGSKDKTEQMFRNRGI